MAAAITMLTLALYGWTLDFPMTFDDCAYMTDNPVFHRSEAFTYLADFREFATWPASQGLDPDLATNMLLRPVAYASFYLNHALDGFQPRWFRLVNIFCHALNAWLVFCILRRLGTREQSEGGTGFVAATAALLFLVHPLATESVTYIVQRFTSMGTLFLLLCVHLHLRSLPAEGARRAWLRTGAVLACLAGMLTKEDVVLAPLLAAGLDWLVLGTGLRAALRRAWPLLLCLPLVPGLVLAVSWAQNGGVWSLDHALNLVNLRQRPWSHADYLITQIAVVAEYLRLLVWPAEQNLHPSWPVHQSLLEPTVLRPAVLLMLILGGALLVWRRKAGGLRSRMIFAFVLWFFATLAISSGLVPLPDMIAEHRTYLPSIGFFVVVACLMDWVRRIPGVLPGGVTAGALVLALSTATCLRNHVWRTDVSLWEDTVAKSPHLHGPWNNLGSARYEAGDFQGAEQAFRKALEIEPRYLGARFNLSHTLVKLRRWKDCHETTLSLLRDDEKARQNLDIIFNAGISLLGMGRHEEGIRVMEGILQHQPDHFPATKLLGMVHHQKQHPRRARHYLTRAEALQPDDREVVGVLASLP
jgi:tetratricopeptide (TPR) repeat protein